MKGNKRFRFLGRKQVGPEDVMYNLGNAVNSIVIVLLWCPMVVGLIW